MLAKPGVEPRTTARYMTQLITGAWPSLLRPTSLLGLVGSFCLTKLAARYSTEEERDQDDTI